MIKRRKTRQVMVGDVRIGGGNPIAIQSMVKVETADVKSVLAEIRDLELCGCEIVRVAVKNSDDAAAVKEIKRKIKIPLVCDIHFNYRLALEAIESGADKIRLNPGNIRKTEEAAAVAKAAKKRGVAIRIGANSGSAGGAPGPTASRMVKVVSDYIKIFKDLDFHDIIISLKSSDIVSTVEAYRIMAALSDYPMHLGVTASGPYDHGIIKSSIGIGSLLLDGIGDTIRVSLTADPADEVIAAKNILSSLALRNFGPEIISCPTCGRCQVDLTKIVSELEDKINKTCGLQLTAKTPVTVALMGCEVNGPGEAMNADIGIAAGKGSGALFIKGKVIRRVKEKDFVRELIKEMKRL